MASTERVLLYTAAPFRCSRWLKRSTRRCKLLSGARSSNGSTLSWRLSPRISERRERSLRKVLFSVRTWYAAKNRDTVATLTTKGRMIFRVVRIEDSLVFKNESGPRGLGGRPH